MKTNINLRYVIVLAVTAALGGLLFGFDVAIITGAGPFLLEHFKLNDLSLGWAFSSLLFGCVLGSMAAGRLTDFYGRKKLLLTVAALFAVTSLGTGAAPTFAAFVAARFIGGLAVGGVSIVSPMYVAEVSPPSLRGRLGALYQMSIVTGILVSYAINYSLRAAGPANWRWMFITGVIPAVFFFAMLLSVPETPRYLFMAGQEQQARAILERIAGRESAEFEASEIRASLSTKRRAWRDLLRPGIRQAVWVGFGLAILVHVSGINTIIDYAPAVLKSAGWKIDAALFSTLIIGFTNFAFTLVSFWAIDRYGRKPLYIVGSLGMTAALFVLMSAVLMSRFQGATVLVCILAYLAFFAACIGPVFWTLVPEIFPNDLRGTAMTVPVLTQWVANAAVVLFFPLAFNQLGKAITFGFLAMMALAQAIFAWMFVPETKNKPLEEVEEYWKRVAVSGLWTGTRKGASIP
ncbi:MAG: sugar porter family MFS transporter [Acidobacteriaceae bacterium]|nr:sugar porter family MFS transporter [Acidobacteriaceae bacterium]MBV8570286.1 sugar porter family MFS transporter [Acidobacteriaceae bacterium]